MRIKQFVIMIMIICGCVSAGCKNKEVQESDKTASDSSRLARQPVHFPPACNHGPIFIHVIGPSVCLQPSPV